MCACIDDGAGVTSVLGLFFWNFLSVLVLWKRVMVCVPLMMSDFVLIPSDGF